MYSYDKDYIKQNLSIEQVAELLAELGGDPQIQEGLVVSRTICHGGNSRKLYYYDNTALFHCFTDCADSFDIFELVRKVFSREKPQLRTTPQGQVYEDDWNLPEAVRYVAEHFGFSPQTESEDINGYKILEDWTILNNYDRINTIKEDSQIVELKVYSDAILKNLPSPKIVSWLDEGMTNEVLKEYGICYDPKNCGIVIPHKDKDGNLIGIRERTLVKENEKYGKYRPAYIAGQLYNHPLGFNLYGLDKAKDNISKVKKAFVFEGEKSVLLYGSYFGIENNIAVACCGSSFIKYQAWLLIKSGAEEIIIAFDKQYQEKGDEEFKKLVKNLKNIHKKYGQYVKISFMFDKENLLKYKASPIDSGPDIFMKLYNERINLY